jgi:hypothetical protein
MLLVFIVYFSVSWYFLCFSSFCAVLLVFNVYFSLSSYFLCFSSFCAMLLVFNVYFSVSSYFLCFSSFCVVLLVFNVYFSLSSYFLCFSSFCAVCQIVYMSLDYSFFIASCIFSNVYLLIQFIARVLKSYISKQYSILINKRRKQLYMLKSCSY